MNFSEWLQQALKSRKITGAELAERADVSKAAVYFYLDGSRIPGPGAVEKLCAALGVQPESVPLIARRRGFSIANCSA